MYVCIYIHEYEKKRYHPLTIQSFSESEELFNLATNVGVAVHVETEIALEKTAEKQRPKQ